MGSGFIVGCGAWWPTCASTGSGGCKLGGASRPPCRRPSAPGTIRLSFNRLSAARPLRCQHAVASGERAPRSGLWLQPTTITPSVAYPSAGRLTLRGATLRCGAAWRVFSLVSAQAWLFRTHKGHPVRPAFTSCDCHSLPPGGEATQTCAEEVVVVRPHKARHGSVVQRHRRIGRGSSSPRAR